MGAFCSIFQYAFSKLSAYPTASLRLKEEHEAFIGRFLENKEKSVLRLYALIQTGIAKQAFISTRPILN